jgi:molybdopterin molybdotransferase
MIAIEEVYGILAKAATAKATDPPGERLETHRGLGRVLAEVVVSQADHPAFSQSAMDGIAFKHRAGVRAWRVIGTVAAGDAPDQLLPGEGECVRIMTGAPLPHTTDTVEMVEKVCFEKDEARLTQPVEPGNHVRRRGENVHLGQTIYPPGTRVTAPILAGLMSQGIRFLKVRPALRIGVAATGDELVDYRHPTGPGQIHNSNGPAVAALLADPGHVVSQLGVFGDSFEATRMCLEANTDLDLLVLSGGVSMGDRDLVPGAAEAAGFECLFHKVRMKPGKPLWFGRHPSGTLLFGLPGNPVSALVGTWLFVRPMAGALARGTFRAPERVTLPLAEPFENRGGLTLFAPARLAGSPQGQQVRILQTSGSGDIIGFSKLDCLAVVPPRTAFQGHELIQVLLLF